MPRFICCKYIERLREPPSGGSLYIFATYKPRHFLFGIWIEHSKGSRDPSHAPASSPSMDVLCIQVGTCLIGGKCYVANESRDVAGGCWRCLPEHSTTEWTRGKSLLHLIIVSLASRASIIVRCLVAGSLSRLV